MTRVRKKWVAGISRLLMITAVAAGLQFIGAITTNSLAAADPSATAWTQLRLCESSGNYNSLGPAGHYGAYQFDLPTWNSVGGTGMPNQASPAEQDFRALYLYRLRGWQPWTCGDTLKLAPDADANSHRIPTLAEAEAVAGHQAILPAWPGKVFSYGQCDPALRTWQLRMNAYGFQFQGTGCYEAKTQAAVLAVQRANGIKDSGLLGPKTWTAAWFGALVKP